MDVTRLHLCPKEHFRLSWPPLGTEFTPENSCRVIGIVVEMIRQAFGAGGWGYASKQEAKTELMTAVTAVLQGRHFIGPGLPNDGFGPNEGHK